MVRAGLDRVMNTGRTIFATLNPSGGSDTTVIPSGGTRVNASTCSLRHPPKSLYDCSRLFKQVRGKMDSKGSSPPALGNLLLKSSGRPLRAAVPPRCSCTDFLSEIIYDNMNPWHFACIVGGLQSPPVSGSTHSSRHSRRRPSIARHKGSIQSSDYVALTRFGAAYWTRPRDGPGHRGLGAVDRRYWKPSEG